MSVSSDSVDGVTAFREAAERKDPDALVACLAPDVVFRSPAVHEPYEGRDAAGAVLRAVTRVFDRFRYVEELRGPDRVALLFEASVGTYDLEGVDLLRFDTSGAVTELTVMLRPFRGLQATLEAVGEELATMTEEDADD